MDQVVRAHVDVEKAYPGCESQEAARKITHNPKRIIKKTLELVWSSMKSIPAKKSNTQTDQKKAKESSSMGAWDDIIFRQEFTVDFLDEIDSLDPDDQVEAILDACTLAKGQASADFNEDEDYVRGLCAATIAAIWAGAPYSAGDVVEEYPFIRQLIGHGDEALNEAALELLENVDMDVDIEAYIEALS